MKRPSGVFALYAVRTRTDEFHGMPSQMCRALPSRAVGPLRGAITLPVPLDVFMDHGPLHL
jgi:hypothetical protein